MEFVPAPPVDATVKVARVMLAAARDVLRADPTNVSAAPSRSMWPDALRRSWHCWMQHGR